METPAERGTRNRGLKFQDTFQTAKHPPRTRLAATLSPTYLHANQIRKPLRRLEGRTRQAAHESISNGQSGTHLHGHDETQGGNKKRPDAASVAQLVEAFASGYQKGDPRKQTCDRFGEALGHLQPRQLTPMLVNGIIASWKPTLAPATLYHRVRVLRRLLKMLEPFGAQPCAALLPKVKRPQPRAQTASREEIAKLLAHAPTWQRLFILLAWQMALRFSECFAVTPASHNSENQTVTIRTKGGNVRTLPTTPDLETLLAAAGDTTGNEETPYIFLLRGKRISTPGIRMAWWHLCDRAGVKNLHPHDLRRTTATDLYAACKDLRAVQQFLGHESLASTTIYLAPLSEERLRDMHRLLNFHSEVKQ